MTDALLTELLSKPVGPAHQPRTSEPDDFTAKIEVNGDTLTATIRDERGVVNEGRALRYIEDEGQDPSAWEVSSWYKVEYGPLDPVFDAEGEPVLGEDGEPVRKSRMESVKFTFRRVREEPVDFIAPDIRERWREALIITPRVEPRLVTAEGGTYVVLIADPQLGKKGTEEAVANYRRGVLGHKAAIQALGDRVNAIHVAWMGDETENVVNSYGNQPHTIELNRSAQLELDFDLRVWSLKEMLELGLPITASSVISNHGEWTRNAGKEPVTTRGDNSSTFIARQVRSVFDELTPFTGQRVDWFIANGEPGLSINLGGVGCYFSHGYIEKGKGASTEIRTRSAIERQILGRTEELGSTQMWFMAHYHHFYSQEFEGRTLFGCPALEAERSSEYMLDQYGVWSPAGLLGMVVGGGRPRGWGDVNVF